MRKVKIITGILIVALAAVMIGGGYAYKNIFSSVVSSDTEIIIPTGASVKNVLNILKEKGLVNNPLLLSQLAKAKKYTDSRVVGGRYVFQKGLNLDQIIHKLRLGDRTPIDLKIVEVEDLPDLAQVVSEQMELDSAEFLAALHEESFLLKHSLTKETLPAICIPNTYEVHWNLGASALRDRMYREYKRFWNSKRLKKAQKLGLSPVEVSTLASIVKKETYQPSEYRRIAGLYHNRLQRNMLLQSDPTIIHCIHESEPERKIRRVLYRDLKIDSRYNTYLHEGLPPGPIAIPNTILLDAVLNLEKHNYIYMCAKADMSGYHAFAKNIAEHNRNGAAYKAALNERRVMR